MNTKYILQVLVLLFCTNAISMEPAPKRQKIAEQDEPIQNAVWVQFENDHVEQVDTSLIRQFASLQDMLEGTDGQTTEQDPLPINTISKPRWNYVVQALQLGERKDSDAFIKLFQQLGTDATQDLLNDFNFLAGPQDILDLMIQAYRTYLKALGTTEVEKLSPDLKKLILKPSFDDSINIILQTESAKNPAARRSVQFTSAVSFFAYVEKYDSFLTVLSQDTKRFLSLLKKNGEIIKEIELSVSGTSYFGHYDETRSLITIASYNNKTEITTLFLVTLDKTKNFIIHPKIELPGYYFDLAYNSNNRILLSRKTKKPTIINISDVNKPQIQKTINLTRPMTIFSASESGEYILYNIGTEYIHYFKVNPTGSIQLLKMKLPLKNVQGNLTFLEFINKNELLLMQEKELYIANVSLNNPSFIKIGADNLNGIRKFSTFPRVNFSLKTFLIEGEDSSSYGTFIFSSLTKKLLFKGKRSSLVFLQGSRLVYVHDYSKTLYYFYNVYTDASELIAEKYLYPLEKSENASTRMHLIIRIVNSFTQGKPFIIAIDSPDYELFTSLPQELVKFLLDNDYATF